MARGASPSTARSSGTRTSYQPGAHPYPYAGHLLMTMPLLGTPLSLEGASLRLSSLFGVSILGIGI
eukprot:1459254-Pyramimonas_sp.AAC.1